MGRTGGQREAQHAVYLFDQSVNVAQPLTVTVENTPSYSWGETLRRIERERSLIRSRVTKSRG